MRNLIGALVLSLLSMSAVAAVARDDAPWGAAEDLEITYKPHKVLYDLTDGSAAKLTNILDRVSYLYRLYGSDAFDSSIVIVIHGDAIPFFALRNFKKYRELMVRANSLTVGSTIEFRMCRAAAAVLKLQPKDIHGFVKMVPMADAEIVRLQTEEGYAYMH